MKVFWRVTTAVTIVAIFFLVSCTPVTAPAAVADVITYSVSGSEANHLADISYIDGSDKIVRLLDQSLPWVMEITLTSDFTGTAFLKADIPQSEVFVQFTSGSANADIQKKLKDTTVDFSANGVVVGDVVYNDKASLDYADIQAIDSVDTLSLNADLFPAGNETYFIYHKKTLTANIFFNGTSVKKEVSESEKILSCLVQIPVAK